jgi:hypothetical protein
MVFSFACFPSQRFYRQAPATNSRKFAPRGFPLKTKNIWEAAAIIPRRARFGHTKMGARRAETGEPIGGY